MLTTDSSQRHPWRVINALLLLATLVVNYLANALPINGKSTGQLSDQYPNLFTPAGVTFSVWGIIYAGLLGFVVYQALPLFNRRWATETTPGLHAVGGWFALTCVLNMGWIFAWHYEQVGLSVGIMFFFLLTLTLLNERLRRTQLPGIWRTRWLVEVPFGLYWGWISIATIANVTAWLVDTGWSGLGVPEAYWAVLMIAVGALVTLRVVRQTRRWAYGLVVLWAFTGIILKRQADPHDARGLITIVTALAMLSIGLMLVRTARTIR